MIKQISEMTVAELRDAGFAVVIFTTDELRGASVGRVEDRLIELGWGEDDCLGDVEDEDEEGLDEAP